MRRQAATKYTVHLFRALAAIAAACATVAPRPAGAQELRYDVPVDVAVVGVGGAAWITSELFKSDLAPSSCRWCATDGFDEHARDALKWSDTHAAGTISNILGFAAVPAFAVGFDALAAAHDDRSRGIGVDALVIVEAGVLAADVNQLTKFLVGRERPFVHALDPSQRALTSQPSDNNVSFFSGHTSVTMALAVASGTVAQMRGYRWAPALWATLPALSLLTGYLRVAADEHWATDVLTGAVVGAAIGFVAPYAFHRPAPGGAPAASLSVAPLGISGVF